MRITISDEGPNGRLTISASLKADGEAMSHEDMKRVLLAAVLGLGGTAEEVNGHLQGLAAAGQKVAGAASKGSDFFSSMWEDLRTSVGAKGCTLCGGPHIAFSCPNKGAYVKDGPSRTHVIGECNGPGGCKTCGSPADHRCYG
jgi:hypothetical protein